MNASSTDPLAVSPLFVAFRTCFISCLGLLIIAGNILSIVVTRRVPDLADSTKTLMTSLAVADLTVGCLTAFSVVASAMNHWPFGDIVCHMFTYTGALVMTQSQVSLICLNIERYIAVTRPYKFPVWCTRRRIIVCIALATTALLCIQITSSTILGVPVKYFEAAAVCFLAYNSAGLNVLTLLTFIVIPVFVMMCIYYRIIKISREHEKRINQNDPNNKNNKALKMFVVVTLAFAVCFTPVLIVRIVESYTNTEMPHWLQFAVMWIYVINSICNLFIYCLFHRSYRQKAKKIITNRLRCCKRSVEPVNIPV